MGMVVNRQFLKGQWQSYWKTWGPQGTIVKSLVVAFRHADLK